MFNCSRFYIILFFVFASSSAFANYGPASGPWSHSSAEEYCKTINTGGTRPHHSVQVAFYDAVSPLPVYSCYYKRDGQENPSQNGQAYPQPNFTCPENTEFNLETGGCEPSPNQCGSELTTIKWTIGKLDSAFNVVETKGPPPATMCISSCLYGAPSMEDVFNGGQYEGSPVWANVDYRGFNESCTPGDGSGGDGSGDGEGDGNGDGNGDNDTPPDTPKPDDPEPSEAEGPAKESTTEDIKNKLDNLAQEHTQQDIKNRLDKVAKESTQKEISSKLDGLAKDSSLGSLGDKIGESNSLLQGIKDAIGEIPNSGGSSNPGDDGEEEEEQSSVTGGDKCDSPPVCNGDAVQCAILNQQYITRCNAEDLYDYEKHKDEIEQLVTGSKFELQDTSIVEMSSFVTGHTRWLSSTCPADETMSLRTNGGRTFSLSYLPLCNAADAIAPLIVIIATLLATLYVGRGAGG